MKLASILASVLLLGCQSGDRKGQGQIVDSPPPQESMCDLKDRAESAGLWGLRVRIEGVYLTDGQSYGFIQGECRPGQSSAIEFTRLVNLEAAGLEKMAEGENSACGEKIFCAYKAKVVVDGVLVRSETSRFGILIDPVTIQEFEIID